MANPRTEKEHSVTHNAIHNQCQGTLLFLATDVLSGTSILKKNFIRVHGRFSKLGVASKLSLKGFKIDGINNSSVIWFYNIKGLFRVAFELGSESFQKDCLTFLQSKWLKSFSDLPLQQDSIIHLPTIEIVENVFPSVGQSSIETIVESPIETERETIINEDKVVKTVIEGDNSIEIEEEQETVGSESLALNQLTDTHTDRNAENVNNSMTYHESRHTEKPARVFIVGSHDNCDGHSEMTSNNVTQDFISEISQHTCINNDKEEGIFQTNTVEEIQTEETQDQFDNETLTDMWKSLTAEVFLQKLDVFLKNCVCMSSDVLLQCVTSNVLVTVNFLQSLLSTGEENFLEDGLIVFQLIDKYSYLIGAEDENIPSVDTFGISRERFLLLYALSDWLGEEFHKLETTISHKVEMFKKDNIQNIANLPSPEETINLLFPPFMKVLIMNWLGETHSADVDFSDHDYYFNEQRRKDETQRYLLAQLILEFATSSLISGISHVVIAKLKSQNLL